MSYYISANGKVHSAGPNGSVNPFTDVVSFERIPGSYYDYGGTPNELTSMTLDLPTIVLKDGSKPIYKITAAIARPNTANCFNDENCIGFPWIGNFLFESNNKQYTIDQNKGLLEYSWHFSNEYVSNKEIFFNKKPFVDLVDRNKGNLLEWQIIDKNIINTYWASAGYNGKYGPFSNDYPSQKVNGYLRCAPSYNSTGEVPSKEINNYTFYSDLFEGDSTFNSYNIKTIRSIPERIDNDMFGFTNHVEQPTDFETGHENPISYFTLNVNDITSRGYTGLKLKLHYNILFNASYNNNYEPQYLEKLRIDNTNCCDSHPFIFNYFLSNSATWDYRIGEGFNGYCWSNPNHSYFNLYSSIVKENDIWKAKDNDTHKLYTFNIFDNKITDPWGDINTYNKFYVVKANTGKFYPDLYEIKLLGYNNTYYVCLDFEHVSNYESAFPYIYGQVAKQNNVYYVVQNSTPIYNISPADNNTTSPAYIDNPSNAPWIKLEVKKYNNNYSTAFENNKFLYECDSTKWGPYSSNFVPIPIINSRNFYMDDVTTDYSIYSEVDNTTSSLLVDTVWNTGNIKEFNKNSSYSAKQYKKPSFTYNNSSFTNLKYPYIGYRNTNQPEPLSNVIYTSSVNSNDVIYYNSPDRIITNISNFIPKTYNHYDEYCIYLRPFNPSVVFTAGGPNHYTKEELSASDVAFEHKSSYNYHTYITVLNVDVYESHPSWSADVSNKTTYWCAIGSLRKVEHNYTQDIDEVKIYPLSIDDLFGKGELGTTGKDIRSFFVEKTNVDEEFDVTHDYDAYELAKNNGNDYYHFWKITYDGHTYYGITKDVPYKATVPQPGISAGTYYTRDTSQARYIKVEDVNYYQNKSSDFFTTSFFSKISTCYNNDWNSTTNYKQFDIIKHNDISYYALMDNINCEPWSAKGTAPYTKNNKPLTWNESGHSLYNSKYSDFSGMQKLKNYNVRGNTEFTIDLSDTDKQYIHIAYPSTTLLDNEDYGKFPNSVCHAFITDLKMTYEGLE